MMNEQSLLGKRDNRVPGVHWPWEPSSRERLWLKNQKRSRVNDSKRNIQGWPLVHTHIYTMHMSTCTCHGQCTLISIFPYTYSCIHIYRRYARITWEIVAEDGEVKGNLGCTARSKRKLGERKRGGKSERREDLMHAVSELCPNPRHIHHKKTFCEHQKQDVSTQAVCFHSGMPSIPLVQSKRQDDHFEFEASLVYI